MSEKLIKSQAYIIQHQQDLLDTGIKRNRALIQALNECELENQSLRKKLAFHHEGNFFMRLLWNMLPDRSFVEPK